MSLVSTIMLLLAVNEARARARARRAASAHFGPRLRAQVPSERSVRNLMEVLGDRATFPTHCWLLSMVSGFFGMLIYVRCEYGYSL